MARQAKFEEEKKCLDSVRKRLNEAIAEAENMQNAASGEYLYEQAIMHREFTKKLRELRVACGESKPKEDKKENE